MINIAPLEAFLKDSGHLRAKQYLRYQQVAKTLVRQCTNPSSKGWCWKAAGARIFPAIMITVEESDFCNMYQEASKPTAAGNFEQPQNSIVNLR